MEIVNNPRLDPNYLRLYPVFRSTIDKMAEEILARMNQLASKTNSFFLYPSE
jgi:hypothetical protein